MSSTNLNYEKSKTTADERKADVRQKNKILGLIIALAAVLLAASVIMFRQGL